MKSARWTLLPLLLCTLLVGGARVSAGAAIGTPGEAFQQEGDRQEGDEDGHRGQPEVILRLGKESFVGRESLPPGAPVVLVLENRSDGRVGYNLCPYVLERRAGDEWIQQEDPRRCTMELRLLEPGQVGRFETALPPSLEPGEYRFRTAIYLGEPGNPQEVSSKTFRVVRGDRSSRGADA